MLPVVLCSFFVVPVLSVVLSPPLPPQNIHVDKWLLTWTPAAAEEGNVTYTVHYSSFDKDQWIQVPACVHISSNSCDVTVIRDKGKQGCVKLRVQSERQGLNSSQVEACSQHGDSCTPTLQLTAFPGSLTVHLSRNHDLAQEYADHAKHRVYYGKEGTPLEDYEDNVSTVSILKLETGQRYCVKVQYTYYNDPVGLPTCPQCVLIPESESKQTVLIVSLVVVLVVAFLAPVIAYGLICHRRILKECIRPPCEIPREFLLLEGSGDSRPAINTNGCTQERYDVISSMILKALPQRD
ncbi:interferon gamma receptor 2 isoform 2-T2 [Symphorus nematophorus]